MIHEMEINKIHNRDCFEFMKTLPDECIDLVVTDPPYNIGDSNKRTKVGDKIMSNMEAWGDWDNYDKEEFDEMIVKVLKECFRILKTGGAMYMFTAREDNGFFIRKAVEEGFIYRNQLAIIKDNPLPHFNKNNYRSAFELCMYITKGKPKTFNFISQQICINIFHYLIGKKETEHPTEKPIEFINRIISISSNENDLVFDPFMGSGTTGKSAKILKRNYIGCELSPIYCEIAKGRLAQELLF